MSSSLFYSKILLFGEYGILKNSRGISIPYHMYKGFLSLGDISNIKVKKSNDILIDFYKYLNSNTIKNKFNLKQFKSDIQSGLYFESSIPIGYGIGSSGALVAALYDKYFIKKVSTDTYLSVFDQYLTKKDRVRPKNSNQLENGIILNLDHDNFYFESGIRSYENLGVKKTSDRYNYVLPYYNFSFFSKILFFRFFLLRP